MIANGVSVDQEEILIPDSLWKDTDLHEKARWLWCYLWAHRAQKREYTFRELLDAVGTYKPTLVKHLNQLAERGWLCWKELDRTRLLVDAHWQHEGPCISLPRDLMDERRLEHAAKWLWGLIRRLDGPFNYDTLRQESPWRQTWRLDTLLWQLADRGWLLDHEPSRVGKSRCRMYKRTPVNPVALRRESETQQLRKALDEARVISTEELARVVLANIVLAVTDGCPVFRNVSPAEFTCPETRQRLRFDVFLPKHRVALDVRRPEYDLPPEGLSLTDDAMRPHRQALYKIGLSLENGIEFLRIPPSQLQVEQVRGQLAGKVPLRRDLRPVAHLCSVLDEAARELSD